MSNTIDEKVQRMHERILKHLLAFRRKHSGFNFILRKSDIGKRLSSGYWFHGNNDYIAISFWTGMDWQTKVPNISLIYIPKTEACYIQFTSKDSKEKEQLFLNQFSKIFTLNNIDKGIYTVPYNLNNQLDFIKLLDNFIHRDKIEIDKLIRKNESHFKTKQNPKNRIWFVSEDDFAKNLSRIQKLRKKKQTENLPIGLYELEIENYGLIKDLVLKDIPADAKWIFFTGENGSGKSTILKAIATALTKSTLSLNQRTSVIGDYSFGLTLQKYGKKSQKQRINKISYHHLSTIEIASKGFVALGPVRLNIYEGFPFKSLRQGAKTNIVPSIFNKPHQQLFSTTTPLIDIGYIYSQKSNFSHELKQNEEKQKSITQAIISICESIVDIHFNQFVRYFEVDSNKELLQDGGTLFRNLASGYKSVIAMVSHIMLHLFYQQQEVNDPSLLEGIVIIDEIDLHFHPKMQRELVIKLSEIFPRVQFIASTHSPIPLLGVQENTPIFKCNIDARNGIKVERVNTYGQLNELLPNALLTSPIFGFESILPSNHTETELINTQDDFNDVVFYKVLDEKLKSIKERYK